MDNKTNLNNIKNVFECEDEYCLKLKATFDQIDAEGHVTLGGEQRFLEIKKGDTSEEEKKYTITLIVKDDEQLINVVHELVSVPGYYQRHEAHIINANAQDVVNVVIAILARLEGGRLYE